MILTADTLALIFASLMGLSILIYVILDGYDLGVGILMLKASAEERDYMIASIGPFWDANETWLVLSVGLLLVAFPVAHGQILTQLYIPTAMMLIALIIRGVSFEFRAKAKPQYKRSWDRAFTIGSTLTAFSQGYMLGLYIMGFHPTISVQCFAILSGICLIAGYGLIGSSWLIMKTEGQLQNKSIHWAQHCLIFTALGIVLISLTTPSISARIFEKWFHTNHLYWHIPIPIITALLITQLAQLLKSLPRPNDQLCWLPFILTIALFCLCFYGLAYSFYPFIIPNQITLYEAASSPESLRIILIGATIVLPCIIGYTCFAYRVFWGKVRALSYT